MWILKVAWLVVAEVAPDLRNVAVVVSAAVVARAVICILAVDVFVVCCWCLCETTVCLWCGVDVFVIQLSVPPVVAQAVARLCGLSLCATICGTDSWITKTSLTQTVAILCGPSVCATFGSTDSWGTKTSTTVLGGRETSGERALAVDCMDNYSSWSHRESQYNG